LYDRHIKPNYIIEIYLLLTNLLQYLEMNKD